MSTKYVLEIDPKISATDAKKTEKQLNGRFAKVAKNYGDEMRKQNEKISEGFGSKMGAAFDKAKGMWLKAATAIGSAIALATSNSFDEIDTKLNDLLSRFDNISTRAKQFGVNSTKYWLYSQIGSIAGVKDQGTLDNALLRIADKLEQAKTGEDTTLANYVNEKDVIDVFYKLSKVWNKMSPTERAASMGSVLGNRQANAFAELVQSDWDRLTNTVLQTDGVQVTPKQAEKQIEKLATLEEVQAIKRAQLQTHNLIIGANLVTEKMINEQNMVERAREDKFLIGLQKYSENVKAELKKIGLKQSLDDLKTYTKGILDWVTGQGHSEEAAKTKADAKQIVSDADDWLTANNGPLGWLVSKIM